MKPNEKKMIVILLIITLIVFVIFINNRKKEDNKSENINDAEVIQDSKLVTTNEDGTKQNISSKLQENKQLGDYSITDINVTSNNDNLTVRANITNNTGKNTSEFAFKIIVLNKSGEEIGTLGAYVGNMKNGETKMINASTSMDINEIYDLEFQL